MGAIFRKDKLFEEGAAIKKGNLISGETTDLTVAGRRGKETMGKGVPRKKVALRDWENTSKTGSGEV